MSYRERLAARIARVGAPLCVGIDPRPELHEDGRLEADLIRLVEETAGYAAAFKPNIAYFEVMGSEGYALMERVLRAIPDEVPVVLDVKRSDIGETQKRYAKAYFETLGVDAVTLNPLLGYDTLEPFLEYDDKGIYLLAVTSNPGASELLRCPTADGREVFELIQDYGARAKDAPADVGLVMGLTNLSDELLARVSDLPFLVPGLGAQGGDLDRLVQSERSAPMLVNVSRGIQYRDPDKTFAEKAAGWAEQLRPLA